MPWFKYQRRCGHYLPVVMIRLGYDGKWSQPIEFLIDSGASMSFMPRRCVQAWIPALQTRQAQNTGLVDASGRSMEGVPEDFELELVSKPGEMNVKEQIWVTDGGRWPLLGQSWFEKIGVTFQNFPNRRRFALYPPPLVHH